MKSYLTRGCKVIVEKLVVGSFASNCYIVGSESNKEGMIIDPGDEAKRILKRVKDLELDIKLIVLTHGHIDHTGALKEVKEPLVLRWRFMVMMLNLSKSNPWVKYLVCFMPLRLPRTDYLRVGIA